MKSTKCFSPLLTAEVIGATTCYAFMQAVGMVNDHVADCEFR